MGFGGFGGITGLGGGGPTQATNSLLARGGQGILGGLKDFFKRPPDIPESPEAAELRKIALAQSKLQLEGTRGLQALAKEAGRGPDAGLLARGNIAREQRLARGGQGDLQRATQARIAQQGLGRSSIGLGALTGIQRKGVEQQQQIAATLPQRIQALQQQRFQQRLGAQQAFTGAARGGVTSQNVPIRFSAQRQKSGFERFGFPLLQAAAPAAGSALAG